MLFLFSNVKHSTLKLENNGVLQIKPVKIGTVSCDNNYVPDDTHEGGNGHARVELVQGQGGVGHQHLAGSHLLVSGLGFVWYFYEEKYIKHCAFVFKWH